LLAQLKETKIRMFPKIKDTAVFHLSKRSEKTTNAINSKLSEMNMIGEYFAINKVFEKKNRASWNGSNANIEKIISVLLLWVIYIPS